MERISPGCSVTAFCRTPSRCTPTLSVATSPLVNETANRFPTHWVRNSPSASNVISGFQGICRATDTAVVAELPPPLLAGLACEPEQPASTNAANIAETCLIHDKYDAAPCSRPAGTVEGRLRSAVEPDWMPRSERLQLASDERDERFDGAWLKLDRAREHLAWLEAAVAEYRASEPVAMRTTEEAHADGSVTYRIVASVRVEPPAAWGPVIGDVVQNARSALDYAVWEITHDVDHQSNQTQMPICDTEEAWNAERLRRLKGVMDFQQEHIRESQPFQHDEPWTAPLSILRELSNRDKHRALHAAALASANEEAHTTNADVTFEHIARVIPFSDDGDVMIIQATPQDPGQPMVVYPHADWAVGVLGLVDSIVGTLDDACWSAERLVRRLEQPDSPW